MSTRYVDVAIIGAGTAGLSAYHEAIKHTDNLVLIESGPMGTTCARVGCMPSKLLIAAAEAAYRQSNTELFGIKPVTPEIDRRAVMQRLQKERDFFVGQVINQLKKIPRNQLIQSRACFLDDHQLVLNDGNIIHADRIVIATGSKPVYPKFFNVAKDRLLVNDDLFDMETLPESIAVFGAGALGLELGQALHRLGVRVRLFGIGGSLAGINDPDILASALDYFDHHMTLDIDAQVQNINGSSDRVTITYIDNKRGEITEDFDYLLAATGRRPNLEKLNLENTRLKLNEQGIPEFNDSTLQCKNKEEKPSTIFIAGDANQWQPLMHEALDEGRIAGKNAAIFPNVESGRRRTPLRMVFTDPQIALVGQSYNQLQQQFSQRLIIGKFNFEHQGRCRINGTNLGQINIYAQPETGKFLGAECFVAEAEHLSHLLAWALQQGMTVSDMLSMPFYHPVIEEGVQSALKDAARQLKKRTT